MRFYHFANRVLKFLFWILLRYRVTGVERVPLEGPLVVCMNHTTFLDPLMVGVFVPRDVVMMSKVENLRMPVVGLLSRLYGAFPVNRGEVDRRALRRAEEVLREGKALLMAPEGTRSKTAQLQRARQGTALIIQRTRPRILPVGLYGGHEFFRKLVRLRRTAVWMNIGEPFEARIPAGLSRKEARELITEQIMYRIAALLPKECRGVYSDERRRSQLMGER